MPGLNSLEHQLLPTPDSLVAAMERQASLRCLQPLVPSCSFYQLVGHLASDQLLLSSYVSAPVRFEVHDAPAIQLVFNFAGHRQVVTTHGAVGAWAGEGMLLPTGFRQVTCSASAAIVALQPERIIQVGAVMQGGTARGRLGMRRDGVFAPLAFGGAEARMLHALIRHIDACAAVDPALPVRLGLDDVIERQVAALLHPGLLRGEPADERRVRERGGRGSFDDLIDYIRANLDQPLRLSHLEARSFYSRRALQAAFRERLNTTPRQWIREQRLDLAMQRLKTCQGQASIRAIALACGYTTMGQFSTDFKRRFGLSPSAVRRQRL